LGILPILLGFAFYLTYRKREVSCEDGTCKIKSTSKYNKLALWGATVIVAFLLVFQYLSLPHTTPKQNTHANEIVEITIPVKGMTCLGCEYNVERAVKKLDGITIAKANHKKGQLYVKFAKNKVTVDRIVEAINKTGYIATNPLQ
jgi:mercuric ion transport protein